MKQLKHLVSFACLAAPFIAAPFIASGQTQPGTQKALINQYCSGCHNQRLKSGGLSFDSLDPGNVAAHPETWEKVVTKMRAGLMPPAGIPRPPEPVYDGLRTYIQTELDKAAAAHPDPGRTEIFHRLNRSEYQNAVRDLIAVDLDVSNMLPADDSSNGFDNMAGTLRLSLSLMERYLSAAKAISRVAVGSPPPAVDSRAYRIPPDTRQDLRVEGLPFGTRGGTLVHHLFPRDADYDIKLEVSGDKAVTTLHQLEVSIDGEQVKVFRIAPRVRPAPGTPAAANVYDDRTEGKLQVRVPVKAGPHEVAATFFAAPADSVEQVREPFPNPRISGNEGGPAGAQPELTALIINGPYNDKGSGETPSRQKIFSCKPANTADEDRCARAIITKLASHAFRRKVGDDDVNALMTSFKEGRDTDGKFENGVEFALRRILVSPEFLYRVEADPVSMTARTDGKSTDGKSDVYHLSDLELASRLSFFLWSSIPDEELLGVAQAGKLKDPAVFDKEVRRMLADKRSEALTTNFAAQWLQTRNLDQARPGDPFSLAFDETLRHDFRRETELFFTSIIQENRSVIELLTANYTFLNQRLAEHYELPGIQGSEFRRVELAADSPRRGILGQGSILTVTSQANRTSPVMRGKWILKNIMGTPPPDPPPNVPALPDRKTQAKATTLRERMGQHRANEPCKTCHSMIDPPGFALENFDAIGRWRTVDESFNVIDPSGSLPDGAKFAGVADLRNALTRKPERFANTVSDRMLTYALGRGLDYYDMPAVRKIVADAAKDNYRMQSIIMGVLKSYPFQNRRVDPVSESATGVAALKIESTEQRRTNQ
jgi:hypothetical protein